MKSNENYNRNVFINCPFDSDYDEIFRAILFTVLKCGFELRCAKEFGDSNDIRINNILKLINESKYSIHDISRVNLDTTNQLPRFNMPLELGILIGCKEFGNRKNKEKEYLILESERFRFKTLISDISGQDIKEHNNEPEKAIASVRNWLAPKTSKVIPSPGIIWKEYQRFIDKLPEFCQSNQWLVNELTYEENRTLVSTWLAIVNDKMLSAENEE